MTTESVSDTPSASAEAAPAPETNPFRRFVKAILPPPVDTKVSTTTSAEEDDKDATLGTSLSSSLLNSPSLAREHQQELSEKWRLERLEKTDEKREKHRDQELQQRRRAAAASPATTTEKNNQAPPAPAEVPSKFSVESKHPEHKRSGTAAALSERAAEEPLGKRPRASVEGEEERQTSDNSAEKGDSKETSRMWKTAGTTVAVAVVAILVAFVAKRAGRK